MNPPRTYPVLLKQEENVIISIHYYLWITG
jgi:hypothetical protein